MTFKIDAYIDAYIIYVYAHICIIYKEYKEMYKFPIIYIIKVGFPFFFLLSRYIDA